MNFASNPLLIETLKSIDVIIDSRLYKQELKVFIIVVFFRSIVNSIIIESLANRSKTTYII